MKALLLGADRLGNIPDTLHNFGIKDYTHWDGRKKGMRKMEIPAGTELIIIFYDFIEHNITEIVKEKAKINGIPCIYSKRTCSDLSKRLGECVLCNKCSIRK